jgi:phenylpropionate dioxygenase-like ring-hydroxylating dioxygenase large terminal subunit
MSSPRRGRGGAAQNDLGIRATPLAAELSVFEDFANVWTIVALGRDLLPGKPLALVVAGERVVLFRDREGAPAALIDRCPHRGVALSLGRVERGEIKCAFHGWRFGPDGRCLYTPWNPDAKRANLSAMTLPVREAHGVLWLFTGPGPALSEPLPPDALLRPDAHLFAQSMVWKVHWTRVMENMLDSPHAAFVHRKTFGGPVSRLLESRPDARMVVRFEPHEQGGRISATVDGEARAAALDYRFPNLMELTLDPKGRLLRILAICIPTYQNETRLTLVTARNFLRSRWLDPLFLRANLRIAEEDRVIVESSLPPCVPTPEQEKSVPSDAGTLAFRRIYRQKLLGSRA